MRLESLPNNMVYTEGSDFWVVAEKSHSSWSSKLDWYINFLMARSKRSESNELSDSLKEIIKEEELSLPLIQVKDKAPLYISTENFLPNKALIMLPYNGKNEMEWLDSLEKTWKDLNEPNLRVFLPKGFNEKNFQDFCKEKFSKNITYVKEETYQN